MIENEELVHANIFIRVHKIFVWASFSFSISRNSGGMVVVIIHSNAVA